MVIAHSSVENKRMTSKASTATAAAAFRALARSRYSTRRFQPNRTIPDGIMRDILESTLRAPSGFNLQPTHVLLVRCQETKQRLAKDAMLGGGNSYRTIDASAMAVFLADLEVHKRVRRIVEMEQKAAMRDPGYMAVLPVASTFLTGEGHAATFFKQVATDALSAVQPMPTIESVEAWSYKNSALLAQTYVFAATSHGLATCMMEGYDARRAKEILRVPDRYAVPVMVATGYEYEGSDNFAALGKTPRLNMDEVFFGDFFGQRLDLLEDIQEHNESENTPPRETTG